VDGQSVAKQRLGKQISIIKTVFYGVRTATVAMQWFGKHVSTIEAVFPVESVQRSDLKNKRRYCSVLSSEFSVGNSHEISSTCEDFMCVIVQWDWDCVI
jgi:hypothetical protein